MENSSSSSVGDKEFCQICCMKSTDPVLTGKLMKNKDIIVHYYCMLLSELPQNGKDKAGILGFQLRDIRVFIKQIQKNVCIYCKKESAAVKCTICGKYFHHLCGIVHKTQHEFFDDFKSYCHEHVKDEKSSCIPHEDVVQCIICLNAMGEYHPVTSIEPKCCKLGWMHQLCLKKYALTSGYYLKCLLCKNVEFRDAIRYQGIFVPDREAEWEMNKDNFSGHYAKYAKCDAENCLNPDGRNHHTKCRNSKWFIKVCNSCGAYGTHSDCLDPVQAAAEFFNCPDCLKIMKAKLHRNSIRRECSSILDSNSDLSLYVTKSLQCILNDTNYEESQTVNLFAYNYKYNTIIGEVVATVTKSLSEEIFFEEDLTFKSFLWKHQNAGFIDENIDEELLHKCIAKVMKKGKK